MIVGGLNKVALDGQRKEIAEAAPLPCCFFPGTIKQLLSNADALDNDGHFGADVSKT